MTEDRVLTSSAQDASWLLHELVPDSAAHNLCRAYQVIGQLDVPALHKAWRQVLGRHDILRTVLVELDGRPRAYVSVGYDAERSFVELTAVGPPSAADRVCAHWAATRLDLDQPPPARLVVVRQAPGEHRVLIVLHDAVADEESMSIVVGELSAGYAAATGSTRDRGPVAVPVPEQGERLRYADFARSQRQWQTTPGGRFELDWWVDALTPAPPPLELPVDRSRPPVPSAAGDLAPFDLGRDAAAALAEFCAATGVTPQATLLAAVQSLLHRYTGEDRIAVAVPASIRPRTGYASVVGPFTNTLVLCGDLSDEPAFEELAGRTERQLRDAAGHRDVPFDQVVQAIRVPRDPRRTPLHDVRLVMTPKRAIDLELYGTLVRRMPVHNGSARADLTVVVDRVTPALTGALEYRSCLFEPQSARRIVEQLDTLLTRALAAPSTPAARLPLETVERLRRWVHGADLVGPPAAPPRPVTELVRERATEYPLAEAVAWEGGSVSYRELVARADAITGALLATAEVAGRPVAVRMASGPRQIAALLGVLGAGAHLVCLGTGDCGEHCRSVLDDVRPACLVLDGEEPGDELAEWFREDLGGLVLDLAALPPATGPAPEPVAVEPGDRAYVAYTSGSTGRPKGIAQTHAGLAQFVTWFAGEFRLGLCSRMAQWAATGYDAALCEIFAALVSGATVCPVPERIRANPDKLGGWLADARITVFQTVPSFARELIREIRRQHLDADLDGLDHVLLAGETLPAALANELTEALPRAGLVNLYGPTEAILATWHRVSGPVHGATPIGRPIPWRQVMVLDENDRPCPAGVTGNLVIRSPYLTLGYVGAAAAETEPFRPLPGLVEFGIEPGGCYRTGDLGRRRWDGSLEFRGRRDLQVKLLGTRLELTEVEIALAAHESVAECVVLGQADADGLVSQLAVYVVPTPDGAPSGPRAWRAHLRRRFGNAMPPATFRTLTTMPRNNGGKIDRRALAAGAPSPADAAAAAAAGLDPVERDLAVIWAQLLGTRPASTADDFFLCGGHSLLVPALLDRIEVRFGVRPLLWECFANSTLGAQAVLIESTSRAQPVEAGVSAKRQAA